MDEDKRPTLNRATAASIVGGVRSARGRGTAQSRSGGASGGGGAGVKKNAAAEDGLGPKMQPEHFLFSVFLGMVLLMALQIVTRVSQVSTGGGTPGTGEQ